MTFTTHPIRPFKALSLAVALAAIAPLHSAVAADVAPTSAARSYTLAPGLLGNVLAQFAALSGVPLSFDSTLLNNQQSPGLQGSYTAQSGFMQLLQGSGYTLQSTSANGYTVVPEATGEAVQLGATTISGEGGAQEQGAGRGRHGVVPRGARWQRADALICTLGSPACAGNKAFRMSLRGKRVSAPAAAPSGLSP